MSELEQSDDINMIFETLSGILTEETRSTAKIILRDLRNLLEDERIQKHLKSMFPYLYTAAFLALSGRAINSDNIPKVLRAVGIEPKKETEELFLSTNIKNYILYLHALYFLVVMGKEVNEDNILKILNAIGEEKDRDAARSVIALYNSKQIP